MKRRHLMPFGAEVLGDGQIRFRLWAPAARRVDVALEDGAILPMLPRTGGWFERVTGNAGTGSLYRYRIDGGALVPDPASRCNPADVHGPSRVVDPLAFGWRDANWRGRPWEEAVIYELHVGAFTPRGNFAGAAERLDYLAGLGVTAIELMPVADFPGARNWGYDGVLPFAPDSRYGSPDDLKALIQASHDRGLMVFLDVVYNHFGPEGNYLQTYAPPFFTGRHLTPWGDGINFDGQDSRTVRDFFIHNALYWLKEYHFDGLRLDAVHTIQDDSRPHILAELAQAVGDGPGRERHVHLMLENDRNQSCYLRRNPDGRPGRYAAQWNDDAHHALHVLLTGETDGYYADYGAAPARHLGRCLAEGYAYQGEPSAYRGALPRGEPSADLPATAFVNFLQSHDQVGNRAFGERLAVLAAPESVRAAVAVLLLAPSVPLLFMGEEFGSRQPFLFFCDFGPQLAAAVTAGRRNEFARFWRFADPAVRERIPDPNAAETFLLSRLDWENADAHQEWLVLYRQLLALRRAEIATRLPGLKGGQGCCRVQGRALSVNWTLGDGSNLSLLANFGGEPAGRFQRPPGELLYATHPGQEVETAPLPAWAAAWFIERASRLSEEPTPSSALEGTGGGGSPAVEVRS
ncbi:MAG: malto-oligosyltrehalose trehalohydrolase [Betaproteobacteria bacterium]